MMPLILFYARYPRKLVSSAFPDLVKSGTVKHWWRDQVREVPVCHTTQAHVFNVTDLLSL
jgi:hypothetical protein